MNTTTKKVELVTLTPDEGMWLMKDTRQGRTYSKKVVLGQGDSASNWQEITEDEKKAYEKEDEERMEREMNAAMGNV